MVEEQKEKVLIQRTPCGLHPCDVPTSVYSLFDYFLPAKYQTKKEYVIV